MAQHAKAMATAGDLFDHEAPSLPRGRRPGPMRGERRATSRTDRRRLADERRRAWKLGDGINVVLFAGVGGACQGIEDAGYPVHIALNHDEVAIAAHRALHPHTEHIQADIFEVDPLKATRGRRIRILWGSPDCTHHSVAVGGALLSNRVRSMPWQLCRWTGTHRKRGLGPDMVFLENVREIRSWSRLIAKRCKLTGRVIKVDGTVAAPGEVVPRKLQALTRDTNKRKAGRRYRRWVKHMLGFGGVYQDRDLVIGHYGVPTTRKRLFGVARYDGGAIAWPEQTHDYRHEETVRSGRLLPHVPAAQIIDWSLPIKSIFDREKALVRATEQRLADGVKRFVLQAAQPFLVRLTHQGQRPPLDLADAMTTITGAHRGEIGLAVPTLVSTTHRTKGKRRAAHDGADAAPTFTAGVKGGEFAVMSTFVAEHRGNSVGQPIDQALGAQTAVEHHALAGTWLVQNKTGMVGHSPLDPVPALVTREGPVAVGAAWLAQHNTGNVGRDLGAGLGVITTVPNQQQVAAACLVHQRGTGVPTSVEDAMRTLATGGGKGGDHVGVGAAFIAEYYGTGGQHQDMRDGLNTQPTRDRFAPAMAEMHAPPLTDAQLARARQVAAFLRKYGAWDGPGEFVTVGPYIIVDIGMRMLRPHEAAAAHELRLPETIELPKRHTRGPLKGQPVIGDDGKVVMLRQPLNKTQAMRLVGNSVPPRMARLLVEANAPDAFDPSLERMAA